MRIDERVQGNIVVIEPKGRLTVETEAHFTETVHRLVGAGQTRLVLNMADVSSIDCCGLGAIAQAYLAAWRCGGELKLLNLTPRSRHMLTVTGLLTVLSPYDSEAEAEYSFGANRHPLRRTISDGMDVMENCTARSALPRSYPSVVFAINEGRNAH